MTAVDQQVYDRNTELEAEKAELLEDLAAAEQREAALAAHVERLVKLIDQAAEGEIAPQDIAVILAGEKSETSLARLKSQWQAAALADVRRRAMEGGGDMPLDAYLSDEIKQLRRQAEGGD